MEDEITYGNRLGDAPVGKPIKPDMNPLNVLLVGQMQHEMTNYATYKNFAGMCDCRGLFNAAKFFEKQSLDELKHFNIIWQFCCDRVGFKPVLDAIPAQDFSDKVLVDIIAESMQLEMKTTEALAKIANEAVCDHMCFAMILDLIKEQREEEKLFADLLQRFVTFGDTPQGTLMLEQEMANL
jgi:ferritin